ncbi:MAG: hypothetical protein GY729_18040 [Desulfobacteraceae bacterium]|nr:hypothetical protein [Desulfobacteraceae bacterium]
MKMNGIRLGENCIRVTQRYVQKDFAAPIYQSLSKSFTNISLLSVNSTDDRACISCCLSSREGERAKALGATVTRNVCSLSVYPHRSDLATLYRFIHLLAKKQARFYDLVSSDSMLTIVIDTDSQEELCDYLSRHIELPPSHTPFSQGLSKSDKELLVKLWPESSAAYVEKKIKTYGITILPDLDLYRIACPLDQMAVHTKKIQALREKDLRFYFSQARIDKDDQINFFFLTHKNQDRIKETLMNGMPDQISLRFKTAPSVSLISFQGPHFGDRYGIANQALSVLRKASIPILMANCSGSCIYIVLPWHLAKEAEQTLLKVFERP